MENILYFAFINQPISYLFNSFSNFVQKLSFNYADFLDILIVAVLIFFVLVLLRRTKATPIFIGIILLAILYEVSIIFNLRLTQTIFTALFSVILVLLVIIFQKELRRFFAFIGLLGLRRKISLPSEAIFDVLLRAVEYMANHKIGALIVLPGRESIDRVIEGGTSIDGKVSKSLLLSIFNKSSPTHDGAIIIEADRIKKFGVHLPLAESVEVVKKFGTRHRAALGLAEVSDAFIVVVSEEKGTISVAHNKKLYPLENISQLEEKLKNFYSEKFPSRGIDKYVKWFKLNYKQIIFSLLLAVSLWILFTYQTSVVQRKFVVPIQFKNLSAGYVVANFNPEEIIVTLSGRETDFRLHDLQSLTATIDLTGAKRGWHQVIIKKEFINNPSTLPVVKIEPESISIQITEIPPPLP